MLLVAVFAAVVASFPAEADYVVRGVPAPELRWPWIAAIEKLTGLFVQTWSFHCGGTLISQTHVLTAAHCNKALLPASRFRVRMGQTDLSQPLDAEGVQLSGAALFSPHPLYTSFHHDLAIITLSDRFLVSRYVSIMPIVPASYIMTGMMVEVAGWGSTQAFGPTTDQLQHVSLEAMDPQQCLNFIQNDERGQLEFPGVFHVHRKVCALSLPNPSGRSANACAGDSGGPLTFTHPATQETFLVGVVQGGQTTCADSDFPVVYTKVTAYLAWIHTITGRSIGLING